MALLTLLSPGLVRGQEEPLQEDTFANAATRDLVLRAREARDRVVEGIDSYEALMREHIYVGMTALRFRRERGLFEQERVARIRWESSGERAIEWIAARQAVPIIGADTRRGDEVAGLTSVTDSTAEFSLAIGEEEEEELRSTFTQSLLNETELPGFAFDPRGDRLAFGSDWALHPLADTALSEYRYALGDTLRLSLPDGRSVVLLEVRVEPRRAEFHLVAGSLWFDEASASLVRASYKPARPFDLATDEPGDAEEVPGILKPIEVELAYATVEYSLHEFQFWLPRRFASEGEARVGRFLTVPVTIEWQVSGYDVNERASTIHLDGPLPEGWERKRHDIEDDDGNFLYSMTTVVPAPAELLTSPELTAMSGERSPAAFTDSEIRVLRDELQTMLPQYHAFRPSFAWGLEQGLLRYNRVEGLSFGAAVTVPVTPSAEVDLRARLGTGDREPYGSFRVSLGPPEGRWFLTGYRRLESAPDHGAPFSTASSATHLLLGVDRGVFYRALGGAVGFERTGDRTRTHVETFLERHRPVERTTDFFLLDAFLDDTVAAVRPAEAGDFGGGRLSLAWFSGIDPNGLIVTGRVTGELGVGTQDYQRASVTLSAGHPLPLGLAGALEVAGGTSWGDPPFQRHFFVGGTASVRGLNYAEHSGDTYWRARAELGTGFAGARLTVFSDLGWAGRRADASFDAATASAGVGASLLDGLFRIDVARAYKEGSRWKLYLYLDGLL